MSDDEDILICAIRYCQGRSTYVVADAVRWVRERWTKLSPACRDVITADLARFLQRGEHAPWTLGMDMDAWEWKELAAWIKEQP